MKYTLIKINNLVLLLILTFTIISCNRNFSKLMKQDNKYNLTTTNQLKDKVYKARIDSFYNSGEEGFFSGKENISIYYKIFKRKDTDKVILISSGRTEAAIKYKELIFDLYKNGYSIYIHDHRGQGMSGRMTSDSEMGYIDNFQYYIDDMKTFYTNYLKSANYNKTYLLAHSMGGAIGVTYLEQNPNDFDAAAFSSPMLGFKPPICSAAKILKGSEPKYAMGEDKYDDDKTTFNGNTLTGSQVRYNRMIDAFAEFPKARLGGVSYDWIYKSCQQYDYIFDNINKLETPFILFSAENEQIVRAYSHQKFIDVAKKLNKECFAYEVENAQHELLIEKDEQRTETINTILEFYSKY